MNKKLVTAAVVLGMGLAALLLWTRQGTPSARPPGNDPAERLYGLEPRAGDAAELEDEVRAITSGDVNSEFKGIDSDLNSL